MLYHLANHSLDQSCGQWAAIEEVLSHDFSAQIASLSDKDGLILPANQKKIRRARRAYTIVNANQHENSNNNTSSDVRVRSVMEEEKKRGVSSDELSSPPHEISSTSDRFD